jgi:hypothetical protein
MCTGGDLLEAYSLVDGTGRDAEGEGSKASDGLVAN